ncbi:MAG: hypothetical protein E7620_07050 [Ruminococcaceae bacterium]|nr:hypothetical protein [Oscillospiraceae bacterium]
MFGYVKPMKPELKIREYECYQAYYCGLCRAMGGCTGECSRLTLSYDFVFLAVIRCCLAGEQPSYRKYRCLLHPTKRRKTVDGSPQLDYCANASALLAYHKCRDDLADERGAKRFKARLASLMLHRAYRLASKRYPALDASVKEQLERLREYEKNTQSPSPDEAAAIFGTLMREVFSHGLEGSARRIASELGWSLGRWIYLVDAADDLSEDKKRKRFNPYLPLFGDAPTQRDAETVRIGLTSLLQEAERAFLLMDSPPCPDLREILANVLYLGLPNAAERVLKKEFSSQPQETEKGAKQ